MQTQTSAIPIGSIHLKHLPSGPQTVTLRFTNHAKRVWASKLYEYRIMQKIERIQAEREEYLAAHQNATEEEKALDLGSRIMTRLTIEEQANQAAGLLYAMTRYDHSDITWEDCQCAVPLALDEFVAFNGELMKVYTRSIPDKPKVVEAKAKPDPTTPAAEPTEAAKPAKAATAKRARGGNRSNASSSSASES